MWSEPARIAYLTLSGRSLCFFFQAEDGIRDYKVTGVQTCALPIWLAGEHGVGDLGRKARLLHLLAARQLGQDGQGQRAVPEGVRLGREAAHGALRGGLPEGEARPPAHHALRAGALLQEPDLRRRGRTAGRGALSPWWEAIACWRPPG